MNTFAQAEPFISELGKQGVLGLMLAVCMILVFALGKLLLAEKDKRISDARQNQNDLVQPIESMSKTLERIEEKTLIAKGRR